METTADGQVGAAPRCDKIVIKEEPKLEFPDGRIPQDPLQPKEEILEVLVKMEMKQDPELSHDVDGSEHDGLQRGWFGWEKQETERDVREHINDWETECPPEICTSNTSIEGDLQETAISDDGIVECSTTYAPTCTRLEQNIDGSNNASLNKTVHRATGRAQLEVGAEKSTHSTVSGAYTQGLLSQEDSSFCSGRSGRVMENEFHELSCSFCLLRFSSKYGLIMHVFSHIDGVQPPAYICKSCGEVFPCNVTLVKHTKVSKCYQVLSADNKEKLNSSDDHERNIFLEVDQEGAITQLIKKKSFNQRSDTYAAEKPHRSDHYGNLSTAGDAKTHASLCTVDKQYKCFKCGKSFLQLVDLNHHEPIHIHKKSYKCHSCGKCFTQLCNLKTHILIHTGRKPYKCDTCGKSFTQLGTLNYHTLIHTGTKPYKCVSCGKAFTRLDSLNRHTLMHTGMKPHKCEVCSKSFTQASDLKIHALIHTGRKPYKCNSCGKCFSQLHTLKAHTLTHTGMKPYQCVSCGKTFTWFNSFKRHTLIHTGTKS